MTATPAPAAPAAERRVDPSMEEILASIRKIIADEESTAVQSPARGINPPLPQAAPPIPQHAAPSPFPAAREEWRRPASVTPISSAVAAQTSPQQVVPPVAHIPRPPLPPFAPLQPFSPRTPPAPAAIAPEPAAIAPEPVSAAPMEPRVEHASTATSAAPAVEAFVAPVAEPVPPIQVTDAPTNHVEGGALVSTATTESIATAFQVLSASVALTSSETIDRHVRDMLRPMLRNWLDDNLPVIVEKLVRVEIERVARGGR